MTIVTTHPDEITTFITENIHRTATRWTGSGAYTNDGRTVILAVMSTTQAAKVSAYARKIDPDSFVVMNSTHEIYGNGFMKISD